MESRKRRAVRSPARQHGFTLVELTLVVALLSLLVLVTAATFGTQTPRAHPAELALQAALAEARELAASTGNATDPLVPTGATVTVTDDPRDATGYSSIIRVFRSRPIRYAGPGPGFGSRPAPLVPAAGFPAAHVRATFHLTDSRNGTTDRPFTILVSHAGYASVLTGYAYDPARNNVYPQALDPGCTEGGVTIVADDARRRDAAPLSCRDAVLQMTDVPYAS
ncbi:MAG: hypothetical protein NVSMB19_16590 [Vulcanimicrobiaceae bacterium]